MKTASWICWLLASCICLAEARYKLRRPLPPPPPSIFKKSWPIGHRISMGNGIHISGSLPHKRMPYKPPNYRIRRPPPVFNVLPTSWKNQMSIHGALGNHAVLPQRPPVKEFHSMNKVPEYSPEYRPEPAAVLPSTHRGGVDDDKGPIHTIPAPNLSPADKPYSSGINSEDINHQRQYPVDINYIPNLQGNLMTNFGFATLATSLPPQRAVTNPTPTQHQYEVTETNEIGPKEYTVQPTFLSPDFDVSRLSTLATNSDLQSNEVFLNHPPISNTGLIGTNIQFGQNAPMQTNLHSSLHVGFPGTASQTPYVLGHQIPDLHVGHPAPAGPPLSATQLYDLLNSFPQKLTEQYTAGQQPQLQQHILQQQLGQLFQPTGLASFSQPQMHSFNYDEQANKQQQQQQVAVEQEYNSPRISTEYNLEAETADNQPNNLRQPEEVPYTADGTEQLENNIDYEETNNQRDQATFFNKVTNNGGISTQFYTTLPSREAAEKLAALAAAGNVNSHLIGQLRKQQEQQQEELQNDEPMPANHKDEDYRLSEEQNDDRFEQRYEEDKYNQRQQPGYEEERYDHRKQYERQRERFNLQRQQIQQRRENQQVQSEEAEKRPLRIMVPDDEEYENEREKENAEVEYEYENQDGELADSQGGTFDEKATYEQDSGGVEFGARLRAKTGRK